MLLSPTGECVQHVASQLLRELELVSCFLFLYLVYHTTLNCFFLNLLIELFQPEFMNFEITDTGYRFRIFFS